MLLPYNPARPMTRIRIERILPAPGEILVRTGEWVEASQRIARVPGRGEFRVLNVARVLGLDDHDLSRVMVKRRGDRVEAGEILAVRRGLLPLWHKPCRSPLSGRLAAVGHGWVVIETESDGRSTDGREAELTGGKGSGTEELDLRAFVSGKVVAVVEQRSVTIEAVGTHILGACGVGGEGSGVLQVSVPDRTRLLTADDIGLGSNNAVLVGGAGLLPDALERAREMRVRGIIVGGINASLHALMPPLPFPVVATEGYGNLPMSSLLFEALKQEEGHEVSLCGSISTAWGRARPMIIIPRAMDQEGEGELASDTSHAELARVGDQVRAVRHPLLGQTGRIASLPGELQVVASGFSLPGAQVVFASPGPAASPSKSNSVRDGEGGYLAGTVHFVPWLNLERIV